MPEADKVFSDVLEFAAHLRSLRENRLAGKVANEINLKRPTKAQRVQILEKTGARCHICGGKIDGKWVADHVSAKALGGEHSLENFLPAHSICNRAKWFYETEEFQWILKMGVFFRTQLEEIESPEAAALAKLFLFHEEQRNARRKNIPSNDHA
jgi:5-methylcytosine-specific restriction endonuclease McrA